MNTDIYIYVFGVEDDGYDTWPSASTVQYVFPQLCIIINRPLYLTHAFHVYCVSFEEHSTSIEVKSSLSHIGVILFCRADTVRYIGYNTICSGHSWSRAMPYTYFIFFAISQAQDILLFSEFAVSPIEGESSPLGLKRKSSFYFCEYAKVRLFDEISRKFVSRNSTPVTNKSDASLYILYSYV